MREKKEGKEGRKGEREVRGTEEGRAVRKG